MGILQNRNTTSHSSHRFDPFEGLDDSVTDKNLFADLSVISDRPYRVPTKADNSASASLPQSSRSKILAAALLLVLTGFAAARFKPWSYFTSQEIVYAYFEVRALDAGGRPIAGAVVKNGGKRVGTTDSFGEWRRYMKVPLGATVPLTIAKKNSHQLLFATKNFAVPPDKPEKSDVELRGSVQLHVVDNNDAEARSAVAVSPSDIVRTRAPKQGADANRQQTESMILTTVETESQEKTASVDSRADESADKRPQPTTSKEQIKFASSHESIWFESNGNQASALSREVLPALRKRAAEIGLRIDPNATWKVRLSGLIEKPDRVEKEGAGLMMISSLDGEKDASPRDFLRAYSPDPNQTARGILFSLARVVNKNIVAQRNGDRWVAVTDKSSPELWSLTPGQELVGSSGTFVVSGESYTTDTATGFYLTKTDRNPCGHNSDICELRTRTYTEVPPVPSWKQMRLKVGALSKDPVKIFVSGYESRPVGDKIFEYWGQDRARVNVTVIQNSRVLYRGQIVNDKSAPVSLPVSNISRR
jgi:hypothetical protein